MIELTKECIKDYLNGMTFEDLEDKYYISSMTIRTKLKELGVYQKRTVPRRAMNMIASRSKDVNAWVQKGKTVRWMSERLGVSYPTVLTYLKEHDLRDERVTIAEQARAAGLNVTTVYQRMRAGYNLSEALSVPSTEFKNRRKGILG